MMRCNECGRECSHTVEVPTFDNDGELVGVEEVPMCDTCASERYPDAPVCSVLLVVVALCAACALVAVTMLIF